MKVLVCGGRNYTNYTRMKCVLNDLHREREITMIIHGDARGADRMSGQWAAENQIPVKIYPAKWDEHGKSAGPIRNQQMLSEARPDHVVIFPGGRGTQDMLNRVLRQRFDHTIVP